MKLTQIDEAHVRRDTPACEKLAYFNNAGAALLPSAVTQAVIAYLHQENEVGAYGAALAATDSLEKIYTDVARLIGALPEEIALMESATAAWKAIFAAIPFQPGDRILASRTEYASNYASLLQAAQHRGVKVEVIPDDETGSISLEQLEARLHEPTKLVALTHVPTHSGLVNPAAAVGRLAKAAGALYLLDACQSVGQLTLDVKVLQCDFLTATGRKFLRAPRGTGFLYVRQELLSQLEPVGLDLYAATLLDEHHYQVRPDARRFENSECSLAARIGLGVALDYALDLGLGNIEQRIKNLAAQLRQQLAAVPHVTLHDHGPELGGIVTFTLASHPAPAVRQILLEQNIVVWVSTPPAALVASPAAGLVRASVHYYNNEQDINRLVEAVSQLTISV